MAGFLTLHLSVCLSVCVSEDKIFQKVYNQSHSFFVGAVPVTQGVNLSKSPRGMGGPGVECGGGSSKFGPNDKG